MFGEEQGIVDRPGTWRAGGAPSRSWSIFLFPIAVVGVVLLDRPVSKRFFAVHSQAADQEYLQQHADQQWGQGHHPPQQPYPPQQTHGHHPPQNGTWGPYPHQQ